MLKSDLLIPYAGLAAGALHPGMSIMELAGAPELTGAGAV